ncbi:MAG: hypothetical protein QOH31_4132 [Verrucomicrobiota bacterium]
MCSNHAGCKLDTEPLTKDESMPPREGFCVYSAFLAFQVGFFASFSGSRAEGRERLAADERNTSNYDLRDALKERADLPAQEPHAAEDCGRPGDGLDRGDDGGREVHFSPLWKTRWMSPR